MTNEQEQFAIDLTDKCPTHEQWLSVVRYGLGTLLSEQQLLMEIITREAVSMAEKSPLESARPSDCARQIMDELGLKFVVT